MRAYIALGSNIGDRLGNLGEALRRIDALDHTDVLFASPVYESEPWGTDAPESFANAVAVVMTGAQATDLLVALKDIEVAMGRVPGPRNAPRIIDLDILLCGDEEWDTPELTVPHPRMLERAFVLTPLLDVGPDVRMPDGTPVSAEQATEGRITGTLGAIDGFEMRSAELYVDDTVGHAAGPVSAETVEDSRGEWEVVYERPGYTPVFSAPSTLVGSTGQETTRWSPGARPDIGGNFAQVVLEDLGIEYHWDPFPPEMSTDPYNLSRPFRLLVPSARATEARAALEEAQGAQIDWDDIPS